MVDSPYKDAGHSRSSSEIDSETAIEMTALDDHRLDSPEDQEYKPLKYSNDDRHSDEESGDENEGDADTAPLVPRERPPGWEGISPGPEPSTWTKVKRIVIEVSRDVRYVVLS